MKTLRIVGIAAGGLIIALGAAIAYLAATFDPNRYKPQIVQAVKERTGRTLRLEGDIALSLWPGIGARIGKASLSERGTHEEFAAVEEARLALKLWPLFSGRAVVDGIEIRGLRVRFVRGRDGATNVDDLAAAASTGAAAPVRGPQLALDIARLAIEDAAVTLTDRAAGAAYALSGLRLRSGRIAPGLPTDIELAGEVRANRPELRLQAALRTRVRFDAEQQRLSLAGLALEAKGEAAGIRNLVARATADLEVRAAAKELSASKFALAASGRRASGELKIGLEAPRIAVGRNEWSGERVALNAWWSDPGAKLHARVELPGAAGDARAFQAGPMNAVAEFERSGAALQIRLAGAVAGSLEAGRIELPQLTAAVRVIHPRLPKSPLDAQITGAATLDVGRQNARLAFTTRLDASHVTGRVGLARFAPPSYNFDLAIDRLDADRYLAKEAAPPAAGAGSKGAVGAREERALDFSALKALEASGSIRIGALQLAKVKASDVRIDVKAAAGRLDLRPIRAILYQGSLAGALSVQAGAVPVIGVKQALSGVDLGPLLRDAADFDALEGRARVSLDVSARGNTVAALKKALNGSAAIEVTHGAIRGIDIVGALHGLKGKLGALKGQPSRPANRAEKTDFSELSGTFTIVDGVAHNRDLLGKSSALRLAGEGTIDIGHERLDYLLKASVVAGTRGPGGRELAALAGITVPVRVTGSFDQPSYRLDLGAVAAELARRELERGLARQLERRLGGATPAPPGPGGQAPGREGLRESLRGIFGR